MTMIWFSYYMAITQDPGEAIKDYVPVKGQWKRWCKKCEAYKPQRTHHCKTCKKCVLKMDHHCPWTINCVGYKNMPHFMRFLAWVIFTTGFVFIELIKRGLVLWEQRNYPAYMIQKSQLVFTLILIPVDGFILLSISLLAVKCIVHIVSGMTQIETWEWERVESQLRSERFWDRVRANYLKLHGTAMPKLTSIRMKNHYLDENSDQVDSDHFLFTIDDIVFPYDLGFWENLVDQLNYPWLWIWPWTGPLGDGIEYELSDLLDEDQLGLPWPPDGGDQSVDEELLGEKHIVKRSELSPREWVNDLGEKLDDYGVDTQVDQEQLA